MGKTSLPEVSQKLTHLVVVHCGEKLIARHIQCSTAAVSQWLNETQDIFIRVHNCLHAIYRHSKTGQKLALRLARLICHAVNCVPVPKPQAKITFYTLLEAILSPNKESTDLHTLFTNCIKDGRLTLEELQQLSTEADDVVQAAARIREQIEHWKAQASERGGAIVLQPEDFQRRMVG